MIDLRTVIGRCLLWFIRAVPAEPRFPSANQMNEMQTDCLVDAGLITEDQERSWADRAYGWRQVIRRRSGGCAP